MAKHITQKIVFKKTKPKELFELYMNPKKHAMIAGSPVTVSSKADARFSAHGGYITGRTVYIVKDKMIVQNWRGSDWTPEDPDSIFTILLEPDGKDTILHAIHTSIPDNKAEGIEKGWHDHYWKPWKQHLAGKKITRPVM